MLDEDGGKSAKNKTAPKNLAKHRPGSSSFLSINLGLDFWRTACLWRRSIEDSLGEIGITHPQFMVLYHLNNCLQAWPNQKTLANDTGIDVATFSQIVRILEKKNFIKRKHHVEDERAKFKTYCKWVRSIEKGND